MTAAYLPGRTVTLENGRTGLRFEPEFWDALEEICARERLTLNDLVQRIEVGSGTRTSAVRVYVLEYFRRAATAAGHRAAGHGAS